MSNVTTGSYIANVSMIGGISIDDSTKKFEHLLGGGDDGTSATQLLSSFTGSTTGSVIAALNFLSDEMIRSSVDFTASQGITIPDDTLLRFGSATGGDVTLEYDEDGTDTLLISGGSVTVADDNKLFFGTNKDASFEYDEDGTDTLLYAGSSLRISDDVKLEFGTGGDASFEYDEDGNDVLLYAGANMRFGDDIQLQFGASGDVTMEYDEDGIDALLFSGGDLAIADDKKLFFGTGKDASIEYDEDGTDELKFDGAAVAFAQAVSFDANVTLGDAATDVTTVTGLLSASQDITLASDKDVNFQGGGGPVLYDSENNNYYRIEVQGGLLVLNDVGQDF